jgi:Protein of unknown function (DUF4019)
VKGWAIFVASIGLSFCSTTFAKLNDSPLKVATDAGLNSARPRVVNVTSDSPSGWLPSELLEREVFSAVRTYFSDLDAGNYKRIYRMMTAGNRELQTISEFVALKRGFHTRAGSVKDRTILKLNWSKDPPNAPSKGIYAAIDITAHYEKIDRHCGYIVLFQSQSGAKIELARSEDNTMSNETALEIEKAQSKAVVDATWAELAANCPNYQIPNLSH